MFRFFRQQKRRRAIKKVKAGDGHTLKPYRLWHIFTHSLFHITITRENNKQVNYALKSRYFADDSSVDLYQGTTHIAYSTLPASIPLENGILEVKSGGSGINKIHYVTDEAETFSIYPDKRSIRGWRLGLHRSFPTISKCLGLLATIVLLTSLVLGLPQIVEQITEIPRVAEYVGTFESPIHLPVWLNLTIGLATGFAAMERALMLRSHWLIDMETGSEVIED
ncbi:hypothetical protein [Shouchella miscanthi]|uniref:Uncharacterized protein n=1 Tax=Shouchella miscanthi TaxID=2598861 RepID=A0ABU6NKY9_9BACI|nr:hypothetical protein [Shouchella miscanthi]